MSRFAERITTTKPAPQIAAADVVTLSEAADILGLAVQSIRGLIDRGHLRYFVDGDEPNYTKAGRVLRADVSSELVRRRARREDARLKAKPKRP